MRQGSEVYQQLKSLAKKKYGQSAGNVGDEGGVAPDIQTADEALDLIMDAISKAGYEGKVKIAMVCTLLELSFLLLAYIPLPRYTSGGQSLVHTICQFARLHCGMGDADTEMHCRIARARNSIRRRRRNMTWILRILTPINQNG